MGRPSRKRRHVDWAGLLRNLPTEAYAEISRPAHLTLLQTRDRIEQLAAARGFRVDFILASGHLMAKRLA